MTNESTLIINALAAGSIILPMAISIYLSMNLLRSAHFALGGHALLGAWFFYFYSSIGFNIYASFLLSIASAAFLEAFFDIAFYRKIRKKENAQLLFAAASFATFALLREIFIFLAAGRSITGKKTAALVGEAMFSSSVSSANVVAVFVSSFSLVVFFLLTKTRTGKAARALFAGKKAAELAETSGIDTQKLITLNMIIAGSLAAVSGILMSFAGNVDADSGAMLLIKAFAAGLIDSSTAGIVMGSMLVGLLENILNAPFEEGAIFTFILYSLYVKSKIKPKPEQEHAESGW